MKVSISGESRTVTKKETRAILRWVARELRVDRYKNPIFIKLSFIKNLKKNEGASGFCIWEDNNYRPRSFTIDIDDRLSRLKTIRTLIHECVHVKQFASGKVQDMLCNYHLTRWKKEVVNRNKVDYMDLPWEIEAYALEPIYYKKWREYNKQKCKNAT